MHVGRVENEVIFEHDAECDTAAANTKPHLVRLDHGRHPLLLERVERRRKSHLVGLAFLVDGLNVATHRVDAVL